MGTCTKMVTPLLEVNDRRLHFFGPFLHITQSVTEAVMMVVLLNSKALPLSEMDNFSVFPSDSSLIAASVAAACFKTLCRAF